jgi:HSP20 family protein
MTNCQVTNRPEGRSVSSRYPLVWDFDQVMNHFFGENNPANRMLREAESQGTLAPAWEVLESDSEFKVILDLPGFAPEDVSVELKKDLLTVTGHRKETKSEEKNHVHVRERKFGKFQRVLAFREPVENDNVAASLENGVLTIQVPKAKEAQPKKIDIRIKS